MCVSRKQHVYILFNMTIRRKRVECCLSVKVSSNSGERRRKFEKKNFRKFSVLRFNYERAMRLLLLLLLNLGHRLLLIRLFLSCTLERASSLVARAASYVYFFSLFVFRQPSSSSSSFFFS